MCPLDRTTRSGSLRPSPSNPHDLRSRNPILGPRHSWLGVSTGFLKKTVDVLHKKKKVQQGTRVLRADTLCTLKETRSVYSTLLQHMEDLRWRRSPYLSLYKTLPPSLFSSVPPTVGPLTTLHTLIKGQVCEEANDLWSSLCVWNCDPVVSLAKSMSPCKFRYLESKVNNTLGWV